MPLPRSGGARRRLLGVLVYGLSAVAIAVGGWLALPGLTSSSDGPRYPVTPDELADARADLATLEVKGRAPRTGYDRDLFGEAWADVDGNGCDTRNDVLARDLVAAVVDPRSQGCVVLTGTLQDPYSGRRVDFVRGPETSPLVQIDHVVALSDAWQKGAQAWDPVTRAGFANDPANLLAVDGDLNQAKGAGDAATWLPPHRPYRCRYVMRQVGVKAAYRLWVTAAERDAIARELDRCDLAAPGTAPARTPGPPAPTP